MSDQDRKKGNILVVDDHAANVSLLFNTLEREDYKVFIAHDGESALERVSHHKPDLILLDIMMPGIDGFETCRKLKKTEIAKDIPIIFMTALQETQHIIRGFESGGVDYITKPFKIEELLARISTHLKLRSLEQELRNANEHLEQKVDERTAELQEEIQERKKVEEQLRIAMQKVERSNQLKTEFLRQMSHEIRTPINAIISFSGMLDSLESKGDPELLQTVSIIQNGSKRLVRTFELMLDMAQMKAGTIEPKMEKINIQEECLKELIRSYQYIAETKNIEFLVSVPDRQLTIKTDKNIIEKVLDNLLDNAFKFTKEGKVHISISATNSGSVRFEIKDTGIGISKDYKKSLFEPFTQEYQGFSRQFEGLGLGLAVAQQLCSLIDAEIEFESQKDKGSVFTLYLKTTLST